jgi:hypothetical protein
MGGSFEAALYGGQAPRKRRTGWIIGGAVAVGVALCVVGVIFAPLAYSAFTSQFGAPSVIRGLVPTVCPGAVAHDTVPTDSTGQFTVQPLYLEALKYTGDASGQPASQRADIWAKDVVYPYPPMADIFTEAVGGVDAWAKALGALDPNTFRCLVYDMQQAHITDHALSILQADAKVIPGPSTLAYLVPWYTTTFGGASQEQSLLIPIWEAVPLDRTLARAPSEFNYIDFPLDHEYLEVARYDRLGDSTNAYLTLLDNMVTDGMADQFAAHMTGEPTYSFMSADQEATLWASFKPTINNYANPNQGADMLGDPANGIPDGAGYQIGDHIVGDYLALHPNVTFNQLAAMDAQTVYAGSGYDGVYNG